MRCSDPPFFIREQVRSQIEKRIEALLKGYRQNLGILGQQGMGKTFILGSLFKNFSLRSQVIPIYLHAEALDFDHFVDRWLRCVIAGILVSLKDEKLPSPGEAFFEAAVPFVPKTVEKIRHLKRQLHREKNTVLLKELFSLTGLAAQETGRKIILMIDEFQALSTLPVANPYALLGHEIMTQANTLFIVTSSHAAKAHEIFREHLTLLFGNFEVLKLAPFSFAEISAFLTHRLPFLALTTPQKKFIIRMTDGHPAYLEMLADRLASFVPARQREAFFLSEGDSAPVPDEDVLTAFQHELFDEKGRIALMFERRLENCRHLSKDPAPYVQALWAVADGRRKISEIASSIQRKAAETKKILSRLVEENFLFRQGAFYTLEDPLFRFWLREIDYRRQCQPIVDTQASRDEFYRVLVRESEKSEAEEGLGVAAKVEALFKEFRNDVLEIDGRKVRCPQFYEASMRPASGRLSPLVARSAKERWVCYVIRECAREEDVLAFLEESKRYRKSVHRKILITIGGIEQNAKLMAQEAKIQLWDLRSLNRLLDLYNQPKVVLLSESEKEVDGSALGTLAQSLHSA